MKSNIVIQELPKAHEASQLLRSGSFMMAGVEYKNFSGIGPLSIVLETIVRKDPSYKTRFEGDIFDTLLEVRCEFANNPEGMKEVFLELQKQYDFEFSEHQELDKALYLSINSLEKLYAIPEAYLSSRYHHFNLPKSLKKWQEALDNKIPGMPKLTPEDIKVIKEEIEKLKAWDTWQADSLYEHYLGLNLNGFSINDVGNNMPYIFDVPVFIEDKTDLQNGEFEYYTEFSFQRFGHDHLDIEEHFEYFLEVQRILKEELDISLTLGEHTYTVVTFREGREREKQSNQE